MPEFMMPGMDNELYADSDDFTKAYVEAMFWTEEERLCEDSEREPPGVLVNLTTLETRFDGPNAYGADDLSPEAWKVINKDCAAFQEQYNTLWRGAGHTDEQAGHDFWLSRNGHGTGFWDRGLGEVGEQLHKACGWRTPFPEVNVYLGDDGKVYVTS